MWIIDPFIIIHHVWDRRLLGMDKLSQVIVILLKFSSLCTRFGGQVGSGNKETKNYDCSEATFPSFMLLIWNCKMHTSLGWFIRTLPNHSKPHNVISIGKAQVNSFSSTSEEAKQIGIDYREIHANYTKNWPICFLPISCINCKQKLRTPNYIALWRYHDQKQWGTRISTE